MRFTYASMFAGIGGFDLAFQRHGWEATLLSEVNKFRRALLQRQFGAHATVEGDIRGISGTALGRINLLAGGFPCDDTSIAAPHREGLAGKRSGLYFEFVRLLAEYMRLVDELGPEWVLIENPDGLLKSHAGRDMAAVVGGLEERGYGWAYRTVDGRRLGTFQRRPRLFILGHRGGDSAVPGQVLGLTGPGRDADPAHPGGGSPRRPHLALAPEARDVRDDELILWRKGANAVKNINLGGYETWIEQDLDTGHTNVLAGYDWGTALRQRNLIHQNGRLRTFTMTEWERLQGFPDGWTEGMSDSQRANALGDAVHTGSADWFASRIDAFSQQVRYIA